MGRPMLSINCMRVRGMSLIELVVVMAIIGILGIVGYPSYRGYMQRTQRTEAKDALIRLASNQERFYLQGNTYTSSLTALGFDASGDTEGGLYRLSVTAATRVAFTATAVPVPGGPMIADVECASFTIDEAGTKTASPNPTNRCW